MKFQLNKPNFYKNPIHEIIFTIANKCVDYIDIGDGCWRRNVMVTILRFW